MKLKVPFIIFNIVLFVLLFTVFFLPLFYADGSFLKVFWKANWFFGPVLILMILIINIIFFKNKKMIDALELEDWQALSMYLGEQIFTKNKISLKKAELLLDTSIVLNDFSVINRLETVLQEKKPKFIINLSLKFIVAKMLSGNYQDLLNFTEKLIESKKADNDWIYFYYAFALHLLKDYKKSIGEYKNLQKNTDNPLIKLLSSYFFIKILKDFNKLSSDDTDLIFKNLKEKIKTSYTVEKWNKFIENKKREIHIMVLTEVINSATDWIFEIR